MWDEWRAIAAMLAQGGVPETPLSAAVLRAGILFLLGWLGPVILLGLVAYALFSLPLRRRERARFFLDLIETGMKQGRSPEQTVMEAARYRDRTPGVRFHLLAAHLESESRLGQALSLVPRFLPPQITALLQVGESLGDLAKVIPACRATLQDGLARSGSAMNWMPLLFYLILPVPVLLFWLLPVHILPLYGDIMKDMEVTSPGLYQFAFEWVWVIALAGLVLMGLLGASLLVYWSGPRLFSWARPVLGPVLDGMLYRIPWRRRRLQRDFVGLLAVLLDAEVPEDRALLLAAEGTANGAVMQRAAWAVLDLQRGLTLSEALRRMDRSSEFQWRLANATHGAGRFERALAGWKEALEAKAFQQEQTAAQLFTTGFVLVNGLMVGLVYVGIFSFLVQMIEQGVLW